MGGRLKIVLVLSAIVAATLACSREEGLKPVLPGDSSQTWGEQRQDLENARELAKQMQEGTAAAIKMGQAVYDASCAICHATGRDGAPRDGEMVARSERVTRDAEHLVRSVVTGVGSMPPKGGNPDLTEERIRATVYYMIDQNR